MCCLSDVVKDDPELQISSYQIPLLEQRHRNQSSSWMLLRSLAH